MNNSAVYIYILKANQQIRYDDEYSYVLEIFTSCAVQSIDSHPTSCVVSIGYIMLPLFTLLLLVVNVRMNDLITMEFAYIFL